MSSNASSSSQQQPQVRFFNTFEPVTSFYRDLLPELARSGFRCHVMISRAQYRSEQQPLHLSTAHRSIAYHRMPAIFAQASSRFAKVSSAALYVVFASLASLLGETRGRELLHDSTPFVFHLGMGFENNSWAKVCLFAHGHLSRRCNRIGIIATKRLDRQSDSGNGSRQLAKGRRGHRDWTLHGSASDGCRGCP